MDPRSRIKSIFEESIAVKTRCAAELPDRIAAAAACIGECLLRSGKILTCGNGGSAADAQHFAA